MMHTTMQRGGGNMTVMHAYVAIMRENLAHSEGLTAGRIARANVTTRSLARYVIGRFVGCEFRG